MSFCRRSWLLLALTPVLRAETLPADAPPVELSPVTVYSPLVANQEPVGSFATPMTALRYEPLVDLQARNLAEGQPDISIRGGTFENTSFSIGAVPIYDPQTGHYSGELPVSPAMLGAPAVRTGAENARAGWNATAGSIAYGWTPVTTGGFASAGAGQNNLFRSEVYSGYKSDRLLFGRTLAADASVAYSESEGTRRYGDHEFQRYNARIQLADDVSQTDLFVGYQQKFVGWVNLYARANSPETDELKTTLFLLNHRVNYGADGDYLQIGAYRRKNVDDYEYNRFSPGLFNPYEHTTYVNGTAFDGRLSASESFAFNYRAGVVADELESTALTAGNYDSRTQFYVGLFPEYRFALSGDRALVATAGANYDDSNRDSGRLSPSAELALVQDVDALQRLYLSYSSSSQLPTYTTINSPAAGLFQGDPDIGRATSENVELGVSGHWSHWHVRAAVFHRMDRDLADWVYATPAAARVAREIDVDTTGFELVTGRTFGAVDLVVGYTWMDKSYSYGSPAVVGSFYALNYAEHRLTAAIVARLGGGFEVRMDNEVRFQADNALRRRNDDVILSSLGLYYAVPRVKGLTLSAQVDNLWDTYYEEVPLVPGSRREFSIGARYAW